MLSETMRAALQEQMTFERENQAFYLVQGATLDAMTWRGSASWMRRQAEDEADHAKRVEGYLIDRGATPAYEPLQSQIVAGTDLFAFFSAALAREQETTERIKMLYYLAEQDEDPQTMQFLHWFLAEQVEEERTLVDILQELSRADCSAAQLILDREYGQR